MPHCTACSIKHPRPVGRRCQRDNLFQQAARRARNPPEPEVPIQPPQQVDNGHADLMAVMLDIRGAITDLDARVNRVEETLPPAPQHQNANIQPDPIIAQVVDPNLGQAQRALPVLQPVVVNQPLHQPAGIPLIQQQQQGTGIPLIRQQQGTWIPPIQQQQQGTGIPPNQQQQQGTGIPPIQQQQQQQQGTGFPPIQQWQQGPGIPSIHQQQGTGIPPIQQHQGQGMPWANPKNIRDDNDLVTHAHAALDAIVNVAEGGSNSTLPPASQSNRGKKSGATRTAEDIAINDIPWPHFSIRRTSDKRPATYENLGVDDFVYGYLSMLEAPRSKLDPAIMLPILKNLMQDSRDFSWPKARDFYRDLAAAVEQGTLRWSDSDAIHMLRMTECRTLKPADLASIPGLAQQMQRPSNVPVVNNSAATTAGTSNNAPNSAHQNKSGASARPPPRPAPPNTKSCVSYQVNGCGQSGEHEGFSHVCAYCLRTKNAMCKHPEADCIRKFTDRTKNGQ